MGRTSHPSSVLELSRDCAILAVDDNPANLIAIEAALGDLAGGLVKATSGREALKLLLERDFAVALLDVQMPEMDGFETAQLIRSRQRSKHLPIIFVTAYGRDDAAIERGYSLGAVDFLFKPIVPQIIRTKVGVFVELHQQTERLQSLERANQERLFAEARQRWEAEELRRDNERKDQFIAMLAHELRNPLMPIVTAVELLKGEPDRVTLERVRTAMERQLGTLRRLVDDLLDIARITSGKITLRRARGDLREVVEQAVDANRTAIEDSSQTLEVNCPDHPVWIHADAVRLVQVVSNLISNASRYTPEGGRVQVTCSLDERGAHVQVRDDGRGIDSEFLPKIFDLFAQARIGGHGLGLGLSLVKRLVDMHGGTVTASSEGEGKGSVFEIVVPVRSALRDTGALSSDVIRAVAPETVPGSDLTLSIQLIDDEDDIRQTMAMLLRSWGHQVSEDSDPERAIEHVVTTRPDAVIVDLGMPTMDGFTVARTLIQRCGEDRPTLIALTGYGSEKDRERTKEAGFDTHLVKPIEPSDLQRELRELAKARLRIVAG